MSTPIWQDFRRIKRDIVAHDSIDHGDEFANNVAEKQQLRRRSAIEPAIGHMKTDGWLSRNAASVGLSASSSCAGNRRQGILYCHYLKGMIGDAQHALLGAAGHNLRMILAQIRAFWLCFFARP